MSPPITYRHLGNRGRLGNQLWEIASTIGLARRYKTDPLFPNDWAYRRWFSVPNHLFGYSPDGIEAETLPELDHLHESTRTYLQDLSFMAGAEAEVRSYFRPSYEAMGELVDARYLLRDSRPVLGIHVRHGDNLVQDEYYPVPSLEYYVESARQHADHQIRIVTDDPAWCDQVLVPAIRKDDKTPRVITVQCSGVRPKEHEPDYETAPITDWIDLFLLTKCQAYCLSNSTFGWWSAWLSEATDVTFPTNWYGPALDYLDASLMFPHNWKGVSSR